MNEQTRWNYIEGALNVAEKRVAELRKELEEIRDLARTGTAPDMYGFTSLEEWEHYKVGRIALMADCAIAKVG